jgi:hypothetical protein
MRVSFGENSTSLSENVELYLTQHRVKYPGDRRTAWIAERCVQLLPACGIYGGNYTGGLFKSEFDITAFTEENLMLPKTSAFSPVGMLTGASFGLLALLALPARAQDAIECPSLNPIPVLWWRWSAGSPGSSASGYPRNPREAVRPGCGSWSHP